jgi:glycerophosphoryl diester phosphodiesterase
MKSSIRQFFFLLVLWTYGISSSAQTSFHASTFPEISAHRGSSRLAPENTLLAFAKAIESGADFIEIDVRTTSDGVQICMHDASLKRTTGLDKAVQEVAYKIIKEKSAGAWVSDQFIHERVPTLKEVCDLVARMNNARKNHVNLYVDCKAIRATEVVRILRKYQLLDSAVFYGDVNTLSTIGKLAPSARLMPSLPPADEVDAVIASLHPYAFDVPCENLDPALVTRYHKIGIKVFSDLLDLNDSPQQYLLALKAGIDLIQTDDVPGVKRFFSEYAKQKSK